MIAGALEVNLATVARVRQHYLAVLACSAPPEGHQHWTLRLLAERLVELEIVESVSSETVRQVLQQPGSSRG